MTAERRRAEREPACELLTVIVREKTGALRSFPLLLRDRSPGGLGGVFVGAAPLNTDAEYYLEVEAGDPIELRLSWIVPLAHRVFNLGFRVVGP